MSDESRQGPYHEDIREIKSQLEHIGRHVVSLIDQVAEVRKSNRRLEERLSSTATELRDEIQSAAESTKASLRQEIAESAQTLRTEIADTAHSLRTEMADTAQSLRAEMADTAQSLRAGMADTAQSLRAEIRAVGGRIETRFDHFVEYFGEENKRNRLTTERVLAEQKVDRRDDEARFTRIEERLSALETQMAGVTGTPTSG